MKRTPDQIRKIMSSVRSKNTKSEILLGRALWKTGFRYRKHYNLPGKPDFVLVAQRIAIFCDGDFWHGNAWRIRGFESSNVELSTYTEYWRTKIQRNMRRDSQVGDLLSATGWLVLRFWESNIRTRSEDIAQLVRQISTSRSPPTTKQTR